MNESPNGKNIFGLCVLAAAIFFGAFLVFRQIIALQQKKVDLAMERARLAPSPVPLKKEGEMASAFTPIPRELGGEDILQEYLKEKIKPGYLQVFRMGDFIGQKRNEGVEYIQSVKFHRQQGTGRVLADVVLFNDSPVPVRPRFQVMLFNHKLNFLGRDTLLYITEEVLPGDKKIETLSLPHGPEGVAFFEIRQLE